MVSARFRSYTSGGVLQVDSDMLTHTLRKSGSGVTVASAPVGNTVPSKGLVPIPAGYTDPIIAVACASIMALFGSAGAGGNATFICAGAVGTAFSYYIFDKAANLPSTSHMGLRLRDAAGNITFDSNYRPLLGMELISETGTATHTGKSLAAALIQPGGFRTAGPWIARISGAIVTPVTGGGPYDWSYQNDADLFGASVTNTGQTVTGGGVSFDDVIVSGGTSSAQPTHVPDFYKGAKIVVADVTNVPANTVFF